MKKTYFFLTVIASLMFLSSVCKGQNGIITTIAGTGTAGYSGDGGAALAANINTNSTNGIAVDRAGNTYIADASDNVVRKISSTGIITTIAGTGVGGFAGDGGPATAALLQTPGDVAIDNAGNIYISDGNNFRIRKINTSGIISTFAGTGGYFTTGDGGPATAASLWPARVNVDNAGNVYVVDGVNIVIRKINTAGIISTFAGNGTHGYSGDGGPATAAQINGPGGVAADAAGNIYIADCANYRIRKVNTSGIISTYAGSGVSGFSGDGGPVLGAQFSSLGNISTDYLGNLYLADNGNNRIRKISTVGIITTVAGSGSNLCSASDNISAISSPMRQPNGVCADPTGRFYFIDNYCNRVRMVTNPADVVADSFSVYITGLCSGPSMTIAVNPLSTGLSIKAYFGDGTNTTTAITGGYVNVSHVYMNPGNYTMKFVLYNGTTAIDSAKHSYEYLFCNSFPIKFYYDGNNNCIKDSTAEPYINVPILTAVDSNGITIDTFSATSGSYYIAYGLPGDIYTFRVLSYPQGLQFSCSGTGIINDTLSSSIYFNPAKYIGFNCNSLTSFDLMESGTATSGRHYQEGIILVDNNFCTPEDATVTLRFSDKYNFAWGVPSPVSVTGHTATWLLHGVSTYNANQVNVRYGLSVPATWITPGDTVMSHIQVDPTAGDTDPGNNTETRQDTVKSSFDPNEMFVAPSGFILSGTQLKYTIFFENTGNDTAHNIFVLDTLSANVVPSSLRIVATSANMNISMTKTGGLNIVRFDFPAINLLDSSHHGLCNGAVIFTINAKTGLPDGTIIFNHAGIFFDDNPVVMTDTVEDVIGIPVLNLNSNSITPKVVLYPNPATDELTIKMDKDTYNSIVITNEIGQALIQQQLSNKVTTVDIKGLPAGLYYITLRGDNGIKVQKFVKM